jgi:Tol biopolymer transport system component
VKRRFIATAVAVSLLCGLAAAQLAEAYLPGVRLAEHGIEGMGVVSTRDNEVRASVGPDGARIVWGSTDRGGGAGGWDLWQATLRDKRWTEPQPLPINSSANDFDPAFSADGRWLYFFSNRAGGRGGDDLYRAAVRSDGSFGAPENLGSGVNSAGDEWAPLSSKDGRWLLFASDGFGGAGRHDLFVARWNGKAFVDPRPVPGVNTAADEFDAAWLKDGEALLFARSQDVDTQPVRLYVAHCDGVSYTDIAPWTLSFNTAEGTTLGPVVDTSKPGEMLVTGSARAPKAGKGDIYRTLTPASRGKAGCLP